MKKDLLSKGLLVFIWKFVKQQRLRFFFIWFLSLVWTLDATVWPYLLRQVIDVFTAHDADRALAFPALKGLIFAGITLWILVEVGFRARDFIKAQAFPKLEAAIRMAMFDHVQHHSPKYFNEHFSGSLANKINDMTTQVTLLLQNWMIFLPALATCVISIGFFAAISPFFAMILGAWIVLHFSACFLFAFKCVHYSNVHGEARSSLAGKIVDSLTNNFAVNLFFRFRFEKSRLNPYQKDEQQKNILAQKQVAWMFLVMSVVFFLGQIILNGLMVYFWLHGKISTGEVVQIFNTSWTVMLLLWFASEHVPQFFQSIGIARQALSIMKDPQDVIDSPHARPLVVGNGEIIFENVSFHYGQKELFSNKHVLIKGGEKVGLVGYSGAGKSSFMNLILRFYSLNEGRILIDGQDIAQVTLESLRKQITLLPQDPLLFHRSLEENIRYGNEEASHEKILHVAELAHCNSFIMKSTDGFQTIVGERGTKLSGGERQRIAIARALLTEAPILLLDEATSALDSVTEQYVQESLETLMKGRTTIIIAHRLSTLSKMDRILVFDHGKIVEQGSHFELLAKEGHYARMWQMQAGGFLPESPS